jgi:hypothetical protein
MERITPAVGNVKGCSVYGSVLVRLNRNFMVRPIARDARQQVQWRQAKSGDWVWADLPGENTIRLRFPADTPRKERRIPTGFDMNVLFYLLAQVQRTQRRDIVIPSVSGMLHGFGLYAHDKARKRVERALKLWQRLTLRYANWHERGDARGEGRRYVLPPPIVSMERQGRRMKLVIHSVWVQLALQQSYRANVALPLPFAASIQNLWLRLTTEPCVLAKLRQGKTATRMVKWQKPLALARKIGLRQHYALRLQAALDTLQTWLNDRGGELGWGIPPEGYLNVDFVPPHKPRQNGGRIDQQVSQMGVGLTSKGGRTDRRTAQKGVGLTA